MNSNALDRTPQRRQIGPLEAMFVPGAVDGPYVVLIHGYGANAQDLLSIHKILSDYPEVNWVFPNGHLEVPIGAWHSGRAWFPVDLEAFNLAIRSGLHKDLTQIRPEGMDEAVSKIQGMIEALDVPMERVILGGFSQGGALATEITLRSEKEPAGLVILSSMLVDEPGWEKWASNCVGVPFFQSHGDRDSLVPLAPAEELERLLKRNGFTGQLHIFHGDHEVPSSVLQQLKLYLGERIGRLAGGA